MPHASPDAVTARLDRLERDARRWRRLALGSWLLLATVALLGQSGAPPPGPPAVVEAERFVLRDTHGRIGATIGWDAGDVPRLALHDAAGSARLVLALAPGGWPGLTLLDADGRTVRSTLVVGPDGAPGLALFDGAGKPRLAVALFHRARAGGAGREPTPAVAAYDAAGALRVTLGIRGTDVAGIELADGRGAARAALEVAGDGTPALALRDGGGRSRATLNVFDDGTPGLNLYAEDGRPRAAMTLVAGRGAALALADRDGAVVWSAP